MSFVIIRCNNDPADKTDRIGLFNLRGNELQFPDEQHAIYFVEVEHPEVLTGDYPNYIIKERHDNTELEFAHTNVWNQSIY
jgi:hypothetical protein